MQLEGNKEGVCAAKDTVVELFKELGGRVNEENEPEGTFVEVSYDGWKVMCMCEDNGSMCVSLLYMGSFLSLKGVLPGKGDAFVRPCSSLEEVQAVLSLIDPERFTNPLAKKAPSKGSASNITSEMSHTNQEVYRVLSEVLNDDSSPKAHVLPEDIFVFPERSLIVEANKTMLVGFINKYLRSFISLPKGLPRSRFANIGTEELRQFLMTMWYRDGEPLVHPSRSARPSVSSKRPLSSCTIKYKVPLCAYIAEITGFRFSNPASFPLDLGEPVADYLDALLSRQSQQE